MLSFYLAATAISSGTMTYAEISQIARMADRARSFYSIKDPVTSLKELSENPRIRDTPLQVNYYSVMIKGQWRVTCSVSMSGRVISRESFSRSKKQAKKEASKMILGEVYRWLYEYDHHYCDKYMAPITDQDTYHNSYSLYYKKWCSLTYTDKRKLHQEQEPNHKRMKRYV